MEKNTLALIEGPNNYGQVTQLTSIGSLVLWSEWNDIQRGFHFRPTHYRHIYDEYDRSLQAGEEIGTGQHMGDPAVFAFIDNGSIIAAGSIYKKEGQLIPSYLPTNVAHAFMTDAVTVAGARNQGLNTAISRARVQWAHKLRLAWVETRVLQTKPASIQAKLQVGFFVDSFYDLHFRLLFPLDQSIKTLCGIPNSLDVSSSPDIPLSDITPDRFVSEFGIVALGKQDTGKDLHVRMHRRNYNN